MAVQNKQQNQDPFAPAPLVQQMAQQQFAMKNGGAVPQQQVATVPPQNVFAGGGVTGKFEAPTKKVDYTNGGVQYPRPSSPEADIVYPQPTTDFTRMQPSQNQELWDGAPQVQNANPSVGPVATPYMKDAADVTPQNVTNFEGMPQQPTGWNPDGSARYDSISSALSGYKHDFTSQQPEFKSDQSKRDGGFFSWLNGIVPKVRNGQRPGESDEDYDRRMTTNRERMLALGDAFRHLGNIAYTNKYAPVQQFNDPIATEEAKYQQRKTDRQKKAALDADAAYKQANLTLKERAAEADRQYKQFLMVMRQDAAGLNRDKFNYRKDKDADKTEYQRGKDKRDFEYKQGRDKVKDEQANKRLQIAQYNATHKGRGGSGGGGHSGSSGGKYWFIDKDGKYRYQPNKTMWEQEYYREYGSLPNETSTSTSTKSTDYKTGKETTQTTRTKGTPMAAQAARQQNAAQQARKNASKPSKPSTNNKNKGGGKKPTYANTKKLGL